MLLREKPSGIADAGPKKGARFPRRRVASFNLGLGPAKGTGHRVLDFRFSHCLAFLRAGGAVRRPPRPDPRAIGTYTHGRAAGVRLDRAGPLRARTSDRSERRPFSAPAIY